MIFTLAFYTNPIKRKQTLTESERNEDHEMEKLVTLGCVVVMTVSSVTACGSNTTENQTVEATEQSEENQSDSVIVQVTAVEGDQITADVGTLTTASADAFGNGAPGGDAPSGDNSGNGGAGRRCAGRRQQRKWSAGRRAKWRSTGRRSTGRSDAGRQQF